MTDAISRATEQQTRASQPDTHIHVEANAGSGKTRVLVSRVARLLLNGTTPDKILCLTYTKAAAGEMKSRLFKTLGEWSITDDDGLTKELRALYHDPHRTFSGTELAEARKLFARSLETPGGLAVQTIHSFCQSLLQRFPLEAGLMPGFDLADDGESRQLAAEARRAVLMAASEDEGLAQSLYTAQARGSDSLEKIFAFAAANRLHLSALFLRTGLHKTSQRLRELLDLSTEATPHSALTAFWKSAPIEALKSAALAMAEGTATDQKQAAILQEVLKTENPELKWARYQEIFFTQKGEVRKAFVNAKIAKAHPAIPALLADEADRCFKLRDRLIALDTAIASEAALLLSQAYIRHYEAGLRARRRLDYADLIAYAVKLLTDDEARNWVRYKLDNGIDHVLVDEAQDNAPEQWTLIEALVEDNFAGEGIERASPKTVFTVGDEKQSIYSFQGAEPTRFLEWGLNLEHRAAAARQRFARPALAVSFRSAREVLDAVDQAFLPEQALFEMKSLDTAPELKFAETDLSSVVFSPSRSAFERYQTHEPAFSDIPGRIELWPSLPRRPALEDPDPTAPVDRESEASASNLLAGLVADEIKRILDEGDAIYQRGKAPRPAEPRDILVLVTKRAGFFHTLIKRLKQAGIPVAGADRMVLKNEPAVQDLINLAEVALNPLEDLKLAEFLKTPFFHPENAEPVITETTLFDLAWPRKKTLWEALLDSEDEALAEARIAIVAARNRIETAGLYGFFADFLNERTPTGETRQKRLFARLGEEARDPVEEFLARAIEYEQTHSVSLQAFLSDFLAGTGDIKREMDEGRGEVRVMTVHGAKGLEAPIVILPDTTQAPKARAERNLFKHERYGLLWPPSGKIQTSLVEHLKEQDLQKAEGESARLLYVALTRAEQRLLVCGWNRGNGAGKVEDRSWYDRLSKQWVGGSWLPIETPVVNGEGEPVVGGMALGKTPEKLGRTHQARTDIELPDWALTQRQDEVSLARSLAPSQLIDEDEAPVLSPLDDDGGHRFRRGSLIHKLLETLPDIAEDRRASAAEAYLATQSNLTQAQKDEIIDETLHLISDLEFAPLFGPGSLAEVSLTGRVRALGEHIVLNGQVDRLVISDHEILIVDYKTNRPPPKKVEDVSRLYIAQMAAYRALLQEIHGDKPVRCALLWTDGPNLMPIPDELLDDAFAKGVKT